MRVGMSSIALLRRGLCCLILMALTRVAKPQDTSSAERFLIPSPVPKLALIVGVEHYERVERVQNAINDAASMAQALRDVGFSVRFIADATQDEIYDYTKDLVQRAGGENDPAIIVFYFAGHGFEDAARIPYMVPVSARAGALIKDDSIPILTVMNQLLAHRKAGLTIFFLDACRTDLGEDSGNGDQSTIFRLDSGDGILGMSASAGFPANSSAGVSINNGPYAYSLATYIPSLHRPLNEVLEEVEFDVKELTRVPGFTEGQRTAVVTNATYSKFYLNPQDEERKIELRSWQAALDSQQPRCVRKYIDRYHGSSFLRSALEWLATVAPIIPTSGGLECTDQ